jgi:aspartate/methionine/tyrosine aminotransferase
MTERSAQLTNRNSEPIALPLPDRLAEIDIAQSPGQSSRRGESRSAGAGARSLATDFSHGDIDAFPPSAAALEAFVAAVTEGGAAAYTTYRGRGEVRHDLAGRIADLTGAPVDPDTELIVTPGTQAGLFLSLSSLVERGDRVGIIEPDYFANRRILRYLGAELVPVRLNFDGAGDEPVLDVAHLRAELRRHRARLLCLSNPNNPTGVALPSEIVDGLAQMCIEDDVFVVMDELYSRQIFSGRQHTCLRGLSRMRSRCLTLLGPSKMESLSGYRIGSAVGPAWLIDRMEAVLSITCLRAPGYGQNVLDTWLTESPQWLADRINHHEMIRDELVSVLRALPGLRVRVPDGGSYLFVQLPALEVSTAQFLRELADEEGIVVTPGSQFGPGFEDHFRLNFSQDAGRAVAAMRRLVELAKPRLADGHRPA